MNNNKQEIIDKIKWAGICIDGLISLRNEYVKEALSMGVTWQELALEDKFIAVKICREQEASSLKEAYDTVSKYIEENQPFVS